MKQQFSFNYEVYNSSDELPERDRQLLEGARETTKRAYAPYSNFLVGAVARMKNGKLVEGTNQENASYPVGICAERVLMSAASSLFPGEGIETLAISYNNKNGESSHPVSPCGICRQSLLEFESRGGSPIRIVLSGLTGKVIVLDNAGLLLPFSFGSKDME
ncbi:MAG: cytidine deaminase [Chitinophagaceae bacterium]|nr:MAG: cytidine deaminase [Chitinophagaceae bacterium]